jgi:hypothetical protein
VLLEGPTQSGVYARYSGDGELKGSFYLTKIFYIFICSLKKTSYKTSKRFLFVVGRNILLLIIPSRSENEFGVSPRYYSVDCAE